MTSSNWPRCGATRGKRGTVTCQKPEGHVDWARSHLPLWAWMPRDLVHMGRTRSGAWVRWTEEVQQ